ncbi:hypothetical protein DFJ73DRAFT_806196 [Zopfochytrium polystomum]|nr:hypothetical protein DFJ73DRAFT_806196 [Zopfochytrium polystomum]
MRLSFLALFVAVFVCVIAAVSVQALPAPAPVIEEMTPAVKAKFVQELKDAGLFEKAKAMVTSGRLQKLHDKLPTTGMLGKLRGRLGQFLKAGTEDK